MSESQFIKVCSLKWICNFCKAHDTTRHAYRTQAELEQDKAKPHYCPRCYKKSGGIEIPMSLL